MKNVFNTILKIGAHIANWRASAFNRAVLNLESVYERIHKTGRIELKDHSKAIKNVVRIYASSPDAWGIVFGLTVISWATSAFSESGYNYGPWQPVVIGLAGLLAGIVPLVVLAFLMPFHLIFFVNAWILTGVNIILSAVVFSFAEPIIPLFFYDGGILYFDDLFWGILVFYTFAILFIHKRINDKSSIVVYAVRKNGGTIQQFLPADKTGPLIALSAQDHYVNIMTENGEHLVRISMKDAIALVLKDEGIRVHRSHWVAHDAIISLNKNSGRFFVTLRNGAEIPVAKSYVSDLKTILGNRA